VTFGAVYVVGKARHQYSNFFVDQALHSIESWKKVSDYPITVCCISEYISCFLNKGVNLVKLPEEYLSLPADAKYQDYPNWEFYRKFFAFRLMPYDVNCFLDADTEILKDPYLAYSPEHDISIAKECQADWEKMKFIEMKGFNSGVIIYKNNNLMRHFFREAEYDFVYKNENYYHSDQTSINTLIREKFKDVLKINVLDQRWNVRLPIWNKIKDPYILHAHCINRKDILYKVLPKWR